MVLGFGHFYDFFYLLFSFSSGDSLDFRDEVEVFFEGHVFVEYFFLGTDSKGFSDGS